MSIKKLTESLVVSEEVARPMQSLLLRRSHSASSLRHREPKHLSWQWMVRDHHEVSQCKDLCFPKTCPKPSFFPRWKKHYIPKDKKSCPSTEKPKQTWKEYFSFLLPDPKKKPPLITCRKLQAERRKSCENPMNFPGYCLNDNCCPVPKEWYGQALVYKVNNPFPELSEPEQLKPCVVPEVRPSKEVCPTKKTLCMDDYAYQRPFGYSCACDTGKAVPEAISCPLPCRVLHMKPDVPVCYFPSDSAPIRPSLGAGKPQDVPDIVCTSAASQGSTKDTPIAKEINVEHKKATCERTSFLKPLRFAKPLPGAGNCTRNFHTLRKVRSETSTVMKSSFRSVSQDSWSNLNSASMTAIGPTEWTDSFRDRWSPPYRADTWSSDMTSIHKNLSFQIGNQVRAYGENDKIMSWEFKPDTTYAPSLDINHELKKIMEESNKRVTYAIKSEKTSDEGPRTLLQKLSQEATKRYMKKAKEDGEPPAVNHSEPSIVRNKFSLCRSKSNFKQATVNFTTDSANLAKKKKDDKVCSGCSGEREAQRRLENPPPEKFLDCSSRPGGRCQREPLPGEPVPDNPYQRSKAKKYSICNQPRPRVCKKERPYKMPCEENTRNTRKMHTSAAMCGSAARAPAFVPLSEIVKSLGQAERKPTNNAWDSHTPESYSHNEPSLPDLTNFKNYEVRKSPTDASIYGKHSMTNLPPIPKSQDEWDNAEEAMFKNKVREGDSEMSGKQYALARKREFVASEPKPPNAIQEATPVNIWEKETPQNIGKKVEASIGETSELNNAFQPLSKRFSTGSLPTSKPTRFSKLFNSLEKDSEPRSKPVMGVSRSQRDFMNPMDE